MTRISVIAIVAAVVVIGIFAMPSFVRADYVQVACQINNESDYAVIAVDEASEAERHPSSKYNVQFDPAGVTVRLPPQFYAPDWTQVDDIEMRFHDRESTSGVLQLHLHNTNGRAYVETVGRVKRSCWNAVKSYIRGHIESKGTVVHMSETTVR